MDKKKLKTALRFGIAAAVLGLIAVIGFIIGKALTTPSSEDPYEQAASAISAHRYGEAYYFLNEELETNPDHTEAYLDLSSILILKNRGNEAADLLAGALEHDVDRPRVRESLAELYLDKGDYQKSGEQYSALLSSSSEYASANRAQYHFHYYLSLLRRQKLEKAEDELHTLRDDFKQTEWYYKALYELVLWNIDDSETIAPLLAILKEESDLFASEIESVESKLEEAEDAAGKRDFAEENGWYGIILLENERCELSPPYFEEAIKVGDTYGVYAKAHHYYGVCLYQLSEYESALTELETALEEDSTDLDTWLYKAYTCEALNHAACVKEAYEKLTTVDANNTTYLESYADYLVDQSDIDGGLSQLEALYNAYSENPQEKKRAAERIVEISMAGGKTDWASNYIDKMNQETADYFAYKARIEQLESGSDEKGESDLKRALEIDPYNARAAYYLALVKRAKGDNKSASDLAAKAVDYDLEGDVSAPAQELLDELNTMT